MFGLYGALAVCASVRLHSLFVCLKIGSQASPSLAVPLHLRAICMMLFVALSAATTFANAMRTDAECGTTHHTITHRMHSTKVTATAAAQ